MSDRAGSLFKMIQLVLNGHENVFHFLHFLKVLEPFDCGRDDPYMTANRNFVRFSLVITGRPINNMMTYYNSF